MPMRGFLVNTLGAGVQVYCTLKSHIEATNSAPLCNSIIHCRVIVLESYPKPKRLSESSELAVLQYKIFYF